MWEKERAKLEVYYGGIADMKERPQAMFVVDTHLENLAVREALRTGVATVGVVDTNADPTIIDYVIPANDDAVGSLQLLISHVLNAWMEGKEEAAKAPVKKEEKKEEAAAPTEAAKEEKKEVKKLAKKTTKKEEK